MECNKSTSLTFKTKNEKIFLLHTSEDSMNPRLRGIFASDLDGTIIDNSGQLSQTMRNVIHQLYQSGIYFTVATGRNFPGISTFNLPIQIPGAFENGGKICFPSGELYCTFPFTSKESEELIDLVSRNVRTIDYVIFSPLDSLNYYILLLNRSKEADVRHRFNVDNGAAHIMYSDKLIQFLYIFGLGSARLGIVGDLKRIPSGMTYTTNTQGETIFREFAHVKAGKGPAVHAIADHLKVPLSRVIIAGNDDNDRSMFEKNFGTRIAVGQTCSQTMKDRATHCAETMNYLPIILHDIAARM